jgi:dTDP-4-amino-4,6-dideoxygalactose transaminase
LLSRRVIETEFAEAVRADLGRGEVFAYASARGALAAVLRAAGVGRGDEVVLSGFTCLAVPTAVVSVGAKPLYVDIDPSTMNTPAAAVLGALGPQVRAVVLQHTMGNVVEVSAVVEAARSRGIVVIEDCALATGTRREGSPIGIDADAAIFSMELSKTISTGWGGVLVVHTPALADAVRKQHTLLLSRGLFRTTRDAWQIVLTAVFLHRSLYRFGRYAYAIMFKLKLFRYSTPVRELAGKPAGDFTALMGLPQMRLAAHQWRRLDKVRALSSDHVQTLQIALKVAGLRMIGGAPPGNQPVSPRVCFLVQNPERTAAWFTARRVELGRWFDGPLSPPPTSNVFAYDPIQLPNAVQLARQIVNLPSHCGMTRHDCDRLVRLIQQYAKEHTEDRI